MDIIQLISQLIMGGAFLGIGLLYICRGLRR
jgi:hypothetical protein